jgi:hypothetical protein
MLRALAAVVALQFFALTSALACDGQPGSVIFEDTFADDSGGWDFQNASEATVKAPVLLFALGSKYSYVSMHNLTFRATDADYCIQVILPKPIAPDNPPTIGVEFWASDYDNFMVLQLSSLGDVSLWSRSSGKWLQIFSVPNAPGFKSDQGAVNALRVNTMAGKITAYLNGAQVKLIRSQVPAGNLRFGMLAEYDKKADALPMIKVTSFKVTSGQ